MNKVAVILIFIGGVFSKDLCVTEKPVCAGMTHYRTIDGTCNNINRPLLGSRQQPLARYVPTFYNKSNLGKPNVRWLSQTFLNDSLKPDKEFTDLFVYWGQFISHDLTLVVGVATKHECENVTKETDRCFNIQIPHDDDYYDFKEQMQMRRAKECNERNQKTDTTGFLDGSHIYGGHSKNVSQQVRAYKDGLLLEHTSLHTPNRKLGFLPYGKDEYDHFGGCGPNSKLLAGDPRADENFMLTALHTLFLREHNRIAKKLKELHPGYPDEKLFEETRKIIIAIIQKITYDDWLPKVIGANKIQQYAGYNDKVDPTMSNVVATAALRFGHAFISPNLTLTAPNGAMIGNIPLKEAYCRPAELYTRNVHFVDDILRGGMNTYSCIQGNYLDISVNDELSHNLFPGVQKLNLDLAALNIQRGRAHGLGTYGQYRRYCHLRPWYLNGWLDFKDFIVREHDKKKVKKFVGPGRYSHPDVMDIWLAGLLEKPSEGAILGETFVCLIKKQFEDIRNGDRFWYENNQFSPEQLETIKGYGISKLICENLDEPSLITNDAFVYNCGCGGYVNCTSLPSLDLALWK